MTKIRDAIVNDPSGWDQAVSDEEFRSIFKLEGDSLKRAPKGYDPEHPLIEDLKRKDFTAFVAFSEGDACSPNFIDQFGKVCSRATPFIQFLTGAIGLPW